MISWQRKCWLELLKSFVVQTRHACNCFKITLRGRVALRLVLFRWDVVVNGLATNHHTRIVASTITGFIHCSVSIDISGFRCNSILEGLRSNTGGLSSSYEMIILWTKSHGSYTYTKAKRSRLRQLKIQYKYWWNTGIWYTISPCWKQFLQNFRSSFTKRENPVKCIWHENFSLDFGSSICMISCETV